MRAVWDLDSSIPSVATPEQLWISLTLGSNLVSESRIEQLRVFESKWPADASGSIAQPLSSLRGWHPAAASFAGRPST